MDFVHDQLGDGRACRVLTVLDQWRCSSPILECGLSLRGRDVAEARQQIEAWRWDDTQVRPHRARDPLTRSAYAATRQGKAIAEAA